MPRFGRGFPDSKRGQLPYIDHRAADRVRELREDAGLSVEGLANAIKRKAKAEGWLAPGGLGAIDPFTLRRIERSGHCPSERKRLVIALYFGLTPRDIWIPANRRHVEAKAA